MPETGPLVIYRGDDTDLYFDHVVVGAIDPSWTVALYLRATPSTADPAALEVAGSLVTAGSATTKATFKVTVTKAQSLTLTAKTYYYAFKRTNTNAERVLREGKCSVKPDIKNRVV